MTALHYRSFAVAVALFLCKAMTLASGADAASATTRATSETGGSVVHDRLVQQYMSGKWDDVSADLIASAKDIAALPPSAKADVDYIRRSVAECRPAWWKQCKAGKRMRFRPVVWGHALSATFAPDTRSNININYVNGTVTVVLSWNAAEMDDAAVEGELEYTKGEHAEVDIWTQLGAAESWTSVPPRFQMKMGDSDKAAFARYLDFRGNVAGAYYAMPHARRWAIWLAISGWSHEYDKVNTVMSRRAPGVLFAAEVMSHPQSYPSIKWPQEPPADGAESKMIWSLQEQVRAHGLTFDEDKTFREAIRQFAGANAGEAKIRQTGKIMLPNGQAMSLDPEADKPLSAARDAWIKAQYGKSTAQGDPRK